MIVRSWVPGLLATTLLACGGGQANSAGPDTPTTSGSDPSAATTSSGPKAPDFTLPTLDGDSISLSDYKGDKVVLIDFWSTTCDPCLAEMPELIKLYEQKKAQGFEILAISTDGPETRSNVGATASKVKMSFPVLLDEETEVMDRYNPKGELPYTVVVDRGGSIVLKRASYQPGDEASWNSLVNAVDSALAGK